MKNSLYITCAFFLLSVLSLSCLDHRDPAGAGQSCQIVQEVVKTGTTDQSALPTSETVVIDQTIYGLPSTQTYSLSPTGTSTFTYNNQGQLLLESVTNTGVAPTTLVIRHEYTPSTLRIVRGTFVEGATNYLLNSRGLIASTIDGLTTYSYNSDDFLVEVTERTGTNGARKTTNIIENGNVVRKDLVDPSSQLTTVYSYDLSRANLPNKRIFEGSQSRNLLTKSVQDYITTDVSTPPLRTNFTSTYTYTYDDQGRVKRRLDVTTYSSGTGGANPTLKEIFVRTTDYTYSCQ